MQMSPLTEESLLFGRQLNPKRERPILSVVFEGKPMFLVRIRPLKELSKQIFPPRGIVDSILRAAA